MNGTLLAIESSGEGGGAAVLHGGEVIGMAEVSAPRTHGAELMVCIDRALDRAGVRRDQIDVIAVNQGPGSYTGLRIGLATAAAIGFALDRPVVGVPCFDAMALQFLATSPGGATELWPVLDARREEVMTACFRYTGTALERAGDDELLSPEAVTERAADGAAVFGDGVAAYAPRWNRAKLAVSEASFALSPASVAIAAWKALIEVSDWRDLPRTPVIPRYFRRITAKTIEERAAG